MNKVSKIACAVVSFALLQACSTTSSINSPANRPQPVAATPAENIKTVALGRKTTSPLTLIAEDFLQAVSQIPAVSANTTIIGSRTMKSGFDAALLRGLKRRGYTIVEASQSRNSHLLTTTTKPDNANRNEVTFTLNLKQVALKRTYILDKGFVRPTSSLFVRGAQINSIRLDDRLFVESFNS